MPNSIITDNRTNFTGQHFQDFAEGYGIRIDWASVGHPRTNGQVERANGLILQGFKPQIFDQLKKFAGHWVDELLAVLGSNFTSQSFWDFCDNSCIEVKYASVAHPWANGQVERINGLVLDGLKKRLYDANSKKGGKWIQELTHVVWGLRTQPSKATGESPFFLTYGSEAILPADIMWKSPRVKAYQEGEADEAWQLELDPVEEVRINALTQSARYLQGVRRYHDRNVQQRSFSIGDLVLWRIQDETGLHKLNSRVEGPFIVSKVTRPGSYRITDADGNEVPNSWNIEHLRRFYPWSKQHSVVSWSL